MKILVVGIKGMAGHVIFDYFNQFANYEVYGVARNVKENEKIINLDVSDTDKLSDIILHSNFDYVINCIGVLNRDAEDNPAKAIWFNSYFPHLLEELTLKHKTKIIHISTDCVFNGKKGGYTENDVKDGIGFYAQSKALGEIVNSKDLTIRTSIIGPELNHEGIGLFNWFIFRDENELLKGYSKAFWSGITTLELAKVIKNLIEQNIVGLIEIAPKKKINKYNLLLLFNEIFRNNKMKIESDDIYQVDKSLISIRQDFAYEMNDYKKMLLDQKEWMKKRYNLYSHYNLID